MGSRSMIFVWAILATVACDRGAGAPATPDAAPAAVTTTCTDAWGTHRVGDTYACECNRCTCFAGGRVQSTLMECQPDGAAPR